MLEVARPLHLSYTSPVSCAVSTWSLIFEWELAALSPSPQHRLLVVVAFLCCQVVSYPWSCPTSLVHRTCPLAPCPQTRHRWALGSTLAAYRFGTSTPTPSPLAGKPPHGYVCPHTYVVGGPCFSAEWGTPIAVCSLFRSALLKTTAIAGVYNGESNIELAEQVRERLVPQCWHHPWPNVNVSMVV